ncbi:MAG TPA: hypothetical protein DCX07_03680 [Phycisphaerales bacterium]|nr:hypothetical protein [Phycisphaerales bacterium]
MAARFAVEILGPHVPVQTLKAADFQPLRNHLFEKYGFDGRAKFVKIIRSMFKWGFENELLEKPVRFGTYFSLPSQRAKRLERAIRRRQRGDRMFTAAQIRHQLEAATDALRAMILLGINGGLGNEDCAQLLIDMIDAKKKTIDYARGKTGIGRVVPLWPETLAALNDVIGNRAEGRVFLTRWGNPFIEERVKKEDGRIVGFVRKDGIADAYGKLLRRLKQYRPGMNFYALRHTLRTIGAELRDTEAIRWIMGHQRSDADGEYIECLPVLRLRKVTDYVHDWLFPPKSGK